MVEEYEFFHSYARLEWIRKALHAAIANGKWPIIRYLCTLEPRNIMKQGFLEPAIKRGDLTMVKWLHGKGFTSLEDPMEVAADYGHLTILQWLYENIPGKGTTNRVMALSTW